MSGYSGTSGYTGQSGFSGTPPQNAAAYGEMTIDNSAGVSGITCTNQSQFYQINAMWTGGDNSGCHYNGNTIVADTAGTFTTNCTLSPIVNSTNQDLLFQVFQNGTGITDHIVQVRVSDTNETTPATITGVVAGVQVGDIFDVRVSDISSAGKVVTIWYANYNMESVSGGTSGYSGYSGKSGSSGYSGGTGTNGTSGYSGTSGVSGFSGGAGTYSNSILINFPSGALTAVPVFQFPNASHIIGIDVLLQGGTNIVGNLYAFNSAGGSGSAIAGDITALAGTVCNQAPAYSITAGQWIGWKTTSTSGSPAFCAITVYYSVP